MKKSVFRQKSIERISSPEGLNDYIKVSNPGVIIVLGAIIVLLIGASVWAIFGRLETKFPSPSFITDGVGTCYVKADNIDYVSDTAVINIDGTEYPAIEIATEPVSVSERFGDYELHIGDWQIGEWLYPIKFRTDLQNGIYTSEIIAERVAPAAFVFGQG